MKMSVVMKSCCVALFFVLTSVSAVQRLDTFNDLKKINFDKFVPSHSLLLLHWFSNIVDIDNNDVIRLTFDPNRGDYGSHHYGNYERMLEQLPQGNIRYQYYTVGNLNREMSSRLPSYVVHPRFGYEGRNRDRIVIRVREQNVGRLSGQIIDRVYITQHYETSDHQGTRYDPVHTYQVTTHLLSQIREFSVESSDRISLMNLRDDFGSRASDSQIRDIRNSWGELACLGLFLFIVIQEKYISNQHNNRRQPKAKRNTHPDVVVNIPESRQYGASGMFVSLLQDEMTLKVSTSTSGKARILWDNVPENLLNEGVMVVLYNNDEYLTYKSIGNAESGNFNTSIPLNEGLQVRLHKVKKLCCFWTSIGQELHRGEKFQNPSKVSIIGYEASLQLFAKDGKACARLFVKKSFNDWRSKFKKSWVGFYTSADEDTTNYEWWQWQWATKFKPSKDFQDYQVYEYRSGMTISPGVQARFILQDYTEKACTACWRE
ncbi:uncharacterized protein PAE49_023138 [Odontesthes bonariensis]|uniref:uncharacterized protein LOC142371691 n=1 Tax=Odontesthes bonariensis TaxID=219752 RepID=UPI003F58C78D